MGMAVTTFQAGIKDPQPHVVRMNLYRAGYDDTRGTLLARYVEFGPTRRSSFPRSLGHIPFHFERHGELDPVEVELNPVEVRHVAPGDTLLGRTELLGAPAVDRLGLPLSLRVHLPHPDESPMVGKGQAGERDVVGQGLAILAITVA
jgi:hypothetical protein